MVAVCAYVSIFEIHGLVKKSECKCCALVTNSKGTNNVQGI